MTIQEKMEQPINQKNALDLYSRFMALALSSQTKGDRDLFESYYRRAEYYLYLMNELNPSNHRSTSSFRKHLPKRNQRRHKP